MMLGMTNYAGMRLDCPIDALPELLRDAAFEVLSFEPNVPLECVLTDVLAAASAVVQVGFDVRGLDHRTMPTTINTLAVAASGLGKGTSYRELLGELDRSVFNSIDLEGRDDSATSREVEERADPPLVFLQDQSYKGLLREIDGFGKAVTIQHEDALGFLESDLVLKHADKLTQLWSGQFAMRMNTARERRCAIESRCSIGIRVQNKILQSHLKRRGEKAYDLGFWPRFIVGVHNPSTPTPYRAPRFGARQPGAILRLGARLRKLLVESVSCREEGERSRKALVLGEDAAQFMRWLKEHIYQEAQSAGFLQPSWNRGWENTLRLSAVFKAVTCNDMQITLEMAQCAWAVVQWSLSQHSLVFGPLDSSRDSRPMERVSARMAAHEERIVADMGIVLGVVAQRQRPFPPFGVTLREIATFSGLGETRLKTAVARLANQGSVWITPQSGGMVSLPPGDPCVFSNWR